MQQLTTCMPANVIDSPVPGTNTSIEKSMVAFVKGFSPSGPKSRMWLHGHFQVVSGGLWALLVRKRITAA